MNVKQTVKKMSAVVTGAAMLGATVMGAMAMDLSDYPAPFVADGAFQGKIVIGSGGTGAGIASDMLGALDIAASVQGASARPVSVSSGGVVVEGGEEINSRLNVAFPGSVGLTLGADDLAGFSDRTIRWDGQNVKTEELLMMSEGAFVVRTNSNNNDEDYGSDAFLNIATETVKYVYEFEAGKVNLTRLEARPLTVNFLGQELRIIGGDEDEVTVESLVESFMEEGESRTVDGNTVTLVRVGQSSVIVDVNGQQKIVGDNMVEFEQSDFFQVEVDAIFYQEGAGNNGANLKLGAELTYTVSTNDPAELFGEPDDQAEAEWLWDINATGGYLNSIGLKNNIPRTDVTVEFAEERPAIAQGEKWSLPNGYAGVTFVGFEDDRREDVTMNFRSFRFRYADNGSLETSTSDVLSVGSSAGDVFYLLENLRTSEIFIDSISWDRNNLSNISWEVGYMDGSDRVIDRLGDYGAIDLRLVRQQTDVSIFPTILADSNDSEVMLTFSFDGKDLHFHLGTVENGSTGSGTAKFDSLEQFGPRDRNADRGDLRYAGGDALNNGIGTRDYDMRLSYGVTFADPESQLDRDIFRMSVPVEKADAVVVVSGPRTSTVAGPSTGGAVEINLLGGSGIGVIDTDAQGLLGTTPLIVVGGPSVNTIARSLLGNPSAEDIEEMFSPGLAKIRLFADQNALLVAGYSAEDTRGASFVLADYTRYSDDLVGTEVEVVVTDASNVQLRTPTSN